MPRQRKLCIDCLSIASDENPISRNGICVNCGAARLRADLELQDALRRQRLAVDAEKRRIVKEIRKGKGFTRRAPGD